MEKNIAIVTGASSGLGKEFTIQIAEKYNYDEIWILARRTEKLNELAEKINSEKNKEFIKPFSIDLGGKSGVERFKQLLETQKTAFGEYKIGLLINNAGFGTYGTFEATPLEPQLDMIELNCTTLTGVCGEALPYLKKGSVIINTASLAGFMPLGNFAVYAASKAYALNFSVALAAELRDKGIKVCALCPGSVSTEFANVASNGARKEVKGGKSPSKVVAHCLKKAFKGSAVALWHPKWKFNAFISRLVSRYTAAWFTYKTNPRPRDNS